MFNVVDFLIYENEDIVLDGLQAWHLPYAHYLCHILAQLIRPPQFQATLNTSRLSFGFYRPALEDTAPASASMDPLAPELSDEDEVIC